MPTIAARKQANGSTRYPAVVRLRRGTTVLHQESRTFTHHSAALSWAKHREVVLEDPAALERHRHGAPTVAELTRSYIDTLETVSRWQRSRQTRREFLDRRCPDGGQARPGASRQSRDRPAGAHRRQRAATDRRAQEAHPAADDRGTRSPAESLPSARPAGLGPHAGPHRLRPWHPPDGRWRSAASNGATMTQGHEPAWLATPSTRQTGTGITVAVNIRRRVGASSPHSQDKPASTSFRMTRGPSAPRSRAPVTCWASRTGASMTCGTRPPAGWFEHGYQIHEGAQCTLHESWNELKRYTNLEPESLCDIAPPARDSAQAPSPDSFRVPERAAAASIRSLPRKRRRRRARGYLPNRPDEPAGVAFVDNT